MTLTEIKWLLLSIASYLRREAANYRHSKCIKITEHVVYSNVMSHLECHEILTHQQFGFRQGYSAELQLLQTIHDLSLTINNKSQSDLILLDFSKAFDRVPHRHFILKLKRYGVRNSVLDWIQSFLSNRTQQVICGGCSSSSVNAVSGVPQGFIVFTLF